MIWSERIILSGLVLAILLMLVLMDEMAYDEWPHSRAKEFVDKRIGPQWPDVDLLDGSEGAIQSDGVNQYILTKISPGHGRWVEDVAGEREIRREENHRARLFHALFTRVLTKKEMTEALGYGESLNVSVGVMYHADEKRKELMDAFYQQAKLRILQK